MTRAEDADAELEAIYAQIPDAGCRGLCTSCCGPIDAGLRERVRMARAGVRLPSLVDANRQNARMGGEYRCPALVDGRCSVYEVRPAICRVWGVSETFPCPYGCRPEGRSLTNAEMFAIVERANCAGTADQPVTLAQIEDRLGRKEVQEYLRRAVPKPTKEI